jgi:hypothetical protein
VIAPYKSLEEKKDLLVFILALKCSFYCKVNEEKLQMPRTGFQR